MLSTALRDYADFNIPAPFQARVRNALNAEARSVKLSNLVGQGGLWYGLGRMIMKMCAGFRGCISALCLIFVTALTMLLRTKSQTSSSRSGFLSASATYA